MKDSGGRIQSDNAHTIATNWEISQSNHSSNKYSLAVSQDENQKANLPRYMYATAHNLGNKQEELELHAKSESYDIIGMT